MRALVPLFLFAAFPAAADVIDASARVDRVTVYVGGASVVRAVEATLPKGDTTLVITGLAPDTDAATIRVRTPDGLTLISSRFSTERLPAATRRDSAEVAAAKTRLQEAEAVLRGKEAGVAAIRARAEAEGDKLAFLGGLGRNAGLDGSAETVATLAQAVGTEALAARTAAIAAETEAAAADVALKPERDAVDEARQALTALGDTDGGSALTVEVAADQAGPTRIEVETVEMAAWSPVYDLYLTRAPKPALRIDKGAAVQQQSGRDWMNVDLTLSTAVIGGASQARRPWPEQRSIISKEDLARQDLARGEGTGMAEPVMEPAVTEGAPVMVRMQGPSVDFAGTIVTYHFPRRIDLRSGDEVARLALGSFDTEPMLRAVAVPATGDNAFLEAELHNTGGELLLPGDTALYSEGALVGTGTLPLIAAGDKANLGFGPIDGVRLTRKVPSRSEGQKGLISTSNRLEERAVLTAENLTGESWPVQLFDSVPYSEQDALAITYKAEPPETEANVDGDRGILRWDFTLAPAEKKELRLDTTLSWPDGQVLEQQ